MPISHSCGNRRQRRGMAAEKCRRRGNRRPRHKSTLLIMNLALLQAQPSFTTRSRSKYKCKPCNCVFTRFATFQDTTLSHCHSKCELTAMQHNGIARDVNTRDKEMNECMVASCSCLHQYLNLFEVLGSPEKPTKSRDDMQHNTISSQDDTT